MPTKTLEPYKLTSLSYIIHDAPNISKEEKTVKKEEKHQILGQYYNDLYKLFLSKLSKFDAAPALQENDTHKLKSLLDELVYVKGLLEEEGK